MVGDERVTVVARRRALGKRGSERCRERIEIEQSGHVRLPPIYAIEECGRRVEAATS